MSAILDFAIIGLVYFALVAIAYFLGMALLFSIYDLLTGKDFPAIRRGKWEIGRATLVVSALNNLSVSVIAAIILSELMKIFQSGQPIPIGPSLPFAAISTITVASTKILLFAALSMLFWFIAGLAIASIFLRKTYREYEREINRKQEPAIKKPIRKKRKIGK